MIVMPSIRVHGTALDAVIQVLLCVSMHFSYRTQSTAATKSSCSSTGWGWIHKRWIALNFHEAYTVLQYLRQIDDLSAECDDGKVSYIYTQIKYTCMHDWRYHRQRTRTHALIERQLVWSELAVHFEWMQLLCVSVCVRLLLRRCRINFHIEKSIY